MFNRFIKRGRQFLTPCNVTVFEIVRLFLTVPSKILTLLHVLCLSKDLGRRSSVLIFSGFRTSQKYESQSSFNLVSQPSKREKTDTSSPFPRTPLYPLRLPLLEKSPTLPISDSISYVDLDSPTLHRGSSASFRIMTHNLEVLPCGRFDLAGRGEWYGSPVHISLCIFAGV